MANKMIAHIFGGGATRISDKVLRGFKNSGEGFPTWEFHYGDTTNVNYSKLSDPLGELFKIESGYSGSASEVDGSGADRSSNAETIKNGIQEYVKSLKLVNNTVGEYHLVFFTTNGGTGSVMGPLFIQELLNKDINVIGIAIGDSSDAVSTRNTINTIASLDKIARKARKALSLVYYNNHTECPSNNQKGQEIVNEKLKNTLTIMSTFFAGTHTDLDNKDMELFIEQTRRSDFNIPNGLVRLMFVNKPVEIQPGVSVSMTRSLTSGTENFNLDYNVVHKKNGVITDKNVLQLFDGHLPLYAISLLNFFVDEHKCLTEMYNNYVEAINKLNSVELKGVADNTEDDDLIL